MNKELKQYFSSLDKDILERIQEIRKICSNVFPDAEEGFKWGKPAYSLKRVLIVYAAYKNHIGFYPTPEVLHEFKEEIGGYKSAKGSVQFFHNKPFPLKLVEKMVRARYRHYLEQDAKWKDPEQC